MNYFLCPEPDTLSAFARGELDEGAIERVALHLEQCATCLAAVETLGARNDTFVLSLRGASREEPVSEACRRAVSHAATFMDGVSGDAPAPDGAVDYPRRIRDYELMTRIGQGGMGTVYKALHVNLKRLVAVKILPPEKMQDVRAVARFHREMEAVGKLVHPHIVLAHDAGEADGHHYLVMEYVDGLDLARLAGRRGPLGVADACELARQAAVGLEHAHRHGLVHRDVKPSNLMLSTAGQTKLLDLGLALLDVGQTANDPLTGDQLTVDRQCMGTADYMAPEQAGDSHAVDIRADIYSLGCTLYKLLVGRAPFGGPQYASTLQKLAAHAESPAVPVHAARPDVPPALSAVIYRMMAKRPADRFATPRKVAEALEAFTAGADLLALLDSAGASAAGREAASADKRTASGCASALEPTVSQIVEPVSVSRSSISEWPRIVIRRTPRGARRPPTWLLTALVTFAAVVLLYATITIIVRDKSGKETRIDVPGDAKEIVVKNNGKTEAVVPIAPMAPPASTKPALPPPDTIDRRVAEQVLALGGAVDVFYRTGDKHVSQLEHLPKASFKIRGILLSNSSKLNHGHAVMIGQLRHLRELNIRDTPLANDDLRELGKIQTLRSLDVTGTMVTDEGLSALESLQDLVTLNVSGITISSRGAQSIGKLGRLEDLCLDDTSVDDEALSHLRALSRLRVLKLRRAEFSDAGLMGLAGLKDLEALHLSQTRISGAGLAHLASLPRLDTLVLDLTWIGDEHVQELRSLPILHELSLRDTQLTDQSVEALSQIKTLTKIDLDGTRVTKAGSERLGDALPECNFSPQHIEATRAAAIWVLENHGTIGTDSFSEIRRIEDVPLGPFEINEVSLANSAAADDGMPLISRLSNLKSLEVSGTKITGEGLRGIGSMPRLQRLWAAAPGVTDAAMELFGNCPLLRNVSVSSSRVRDIGEAKLGRLMLNYVDASFTALSDDALVELPVDRLVQLHLWNCRGVTDVGLAHLSHARDVEHLTLIGTSITDTGLQHLVNLRRLSELNLDATGLVREGSPHLAKFSQLERLQLENTKVNDDQLAAVSELDRLCELSLISTEITDAGLEHLRPLNDLDLLRLDGTKVSEHGVARLQEALPNCTIFSSFNPERP